MYQNLNESTKALSYLNSFGGHLLTVHVPLGFDQRFNDVLGATWCKKNETKSKAKRLITENFSFPEVYLK